MDPVAASELVVQRVSESEPSQGAAFFLTPALPTNGRSDVDVVVVVVVAPAWAVSSDVGE